MSNNILKIMEAYKSMVSEGKELDEMRGATAGRRQSRTFPLNKQSEADAFAKKHGGEVKKKGMTLYVTWDLPEEAELEEKKLDPVDDKENDKEFKDRKDKDIDNDGDVDSSDEYLHKRRKATDDAIDAKKESCGKMKKEAKEDEVEEPEEAPAPKKPKVSPRAQSTKDIKHNDHTSDKKAEISKIESVDTREAFIAMWSELEEAVNPKKGATAPEEIDSKESPKSKEFIDQHKKSDKKIEDAEEDGHDKTFKAGGKAMKQAPSRGNDNLKNGDTNVVNPVKGK